MNRELQFEELPKRADLIGNHAGLYYHLLWSRAKVVGITYDPKAATVSLVLDWMITGTDSGWKRVEIPDNTLVLQVDPKRNQPMLSHDGQRVEFWAKGFGDVILYTVPDHNIDESSLKGICQGISFEITQQNSKISTFTPLAKIDVGFREYQLGPAAFNIIGYDYVGREILRMGISEPFAKTFAEKLLEVCNMERRDRPLIP